MNISEEIGTYQIHIYQLLILIFCLKRRFTLEICWRILGYIIGQDYGYKNTYMVNNTLILRLFSFVTCGFLFQYFQHFHSSPRANGPEIVLRLSDMMRSRNIPWMQSFVSRLGDGDEYHLFWSWLLTWECMTILVVSRIDRLLMFA